MTPPPRVSIAHDVDESIGPDGDVSKAAIEVLPFTSDEPLLLLHRMSVEHHADELTRLQRNKEEVAPPLWKSVTTVKSQVGDGERLPAFVGLDRWSIVVAKSWLEARQTGMYRKSVISVPQRTKANMSG